MAAEFAARLEAGPVLRVWETASETEVDEAATGVYLWHRLVTGPAVSQVVFSYNHERFVEQCLDSVAGQTFDRIVAHPPYVPALSQSQVFRDAGEAGESVLEQIVAGLPDHLRSGGTFVSVSAGWDTTEGPFEERIRRWLGDYTGEFDVILAEEQAMSPAQVARWLLTSSLQGKFIEYTANFQHANDLGGEQTSLIDSVEIHELIHVVQSDRPGADASPDFLVNDLPDPDNLPDTLYLSDGTSALQMVMTADGKHVYVLLNRAQDEGTELHALAVGPDDRLTADPSCLFLTRDPEQLP